MSIKLSRELKICISVFFFILLFFIIGHQNVMPQMQPVPRVTIKSPKDKSLVRMDSIKVKGTYAPKGIEDDIWVIVWPKKAPGKGYPQSDDAQSGAPAKKVNGAWQVTCHLGGHPQEYEIAVYTATKPASSSLGDMLKRCYTNDDYPGISEKDLPNKGLIKKHSITVTKP